jgi:hypothetical protein
MPIPLSVAGPVCWLATIKPITYRLILFPNQNDSTHENKVSMACGHCTVVLSPRNPFRATGKQRVDRAAISRSTELRGGLD